jgi:hypothetical protein
VIAQCQREPEEEAKLARERLLEQRERESAEERARSESENRRDREVADEIVGWGGEFWGGVGGAAGPGNAAGPANQQQGLLGMPPQIQLALMQAQAQAQQQQHHQAAETQQTQGTAAEGEDDTQAHEGGAVLAGFIGSSGDGAEDGALANNVDDFILGPLTQVGQAGADGHAVIPPLYASSATMVAAEAGPVGNEGGLDGLEEDALPQLHPAIESDENTVQVVQQQQQHQQDGEQVAGNNVAAGENFTIEGERVIGDDESIVEAVIMALHAQEIGGDTEEDEDEEEDGWVVDGDELVDHNTHAPGPEAAGVAGAEQ